jgi:hypothetical protein
MVKKRKTKTKITDKLNLREALVDASQFPWNIKSESVKEVTCPAILEYVPGKLRGKFMEELYRILIPGGTATIVSAYYAGSMGVQDFRYEWPPIAEQSFLFFNKGWREAQSANLELACDFDFTYGYVFEPECAAKSPDVQPFWVKHYGNTVNALQVNLTKRPAITETKE